MNKAELVESAVSRTGLSRRQVEAVVDSVLETAEAALARGDTVILKGFMRLAPDGRGGTRVRLGPRFGGKTEP